MPFYNRTRFSSQGKSQFKKLSRRQAECARLVVSALSQEYRDGRLVFLPYEPCEGFRLTDQFVYLRDGVRVTYCLVEDVIEIDWITVLNEGALEVLGLSSAPKKSETAGPTLLTVSPPISHLLNGSPSRRTEECAWKQKTICIPIPNEDGQFVTVENYLHFPKPREKLKADAKKRVGMRLGGIEFFKHREPPQIVYGEIIEVGSELISVFSVRGYWNDEP